MLHSPQLLVDIMINLYWLQTHSKHVFFGTNFFSQFSLDHFLNILLFEVILDSLLVILFALIFLHSLTDYIL